MICSIFWSLHFDFPRFFGGPGGYKKVREAGRKISSKDRLKRPPWCRVMTPKPKKFATIKFTTITAYNYKKTAKRYKNVGKYFKKHLAKRPGQKNPREDVLCGGPLIGFHRLYIVHVFLCIAMFQFRCLHDSLSILICCRLLRLDMLVVKCIMLALKPSSIGFICAFWMEHTSVYTHIDS